MQPNSLLLVFALLITALGAVLLFAALRLGVAARRTRRRALETPDESVLLTEALGEAVERIRQQERETHARAEASERLSEQIIDSLASGLLVVDVAGAVQILNPAARRLLGVTAAEPTGPFRDLIGVLAAPLADVIDECVSTKLAIPRSTIRLLSGHAGTAAHCIAPGFLDSDLKVIISTQPRPGRRSRVALEPGCDSRTSPASTARCTSA